MIPLHLHTTYSFVDGMCDPKGLAKRASELKLPACAVTDHRHMGSAIHVYQALKGKGIKPILGMEADVTGLVSQRRDHHLIVLAMNVDGYKELMRLATLQQKGPLDPNLLQSKDLIIMTSCCSGEVPGAVARGRMDAAKAALRNMRSMFGDRLYVELQATTGTHARINSALAELADDLNVKVAVTNDVHYLKKEDHDPQNVLMAVGGAKHQHAAPVYYLRSAAESLEACGILGIPRVAIDATYEIADRCNVELKLGKPDLPPFARDEQTMLREKSHAGLVVRGLTATDYKARLDFELDVICKMGFAGYFLIVQDFVNWARDNGVAVGPGRGSGAGSLVAYALGITDLDPIQYELLFERFLNPERVSMPDFDIDFAQAGRKRVMEYVVERYGRNHVGQIATYMSLHPKSAIKDVSRVLGLPFGEINELTRQIPQILKMETDEEKELGEFAFALTFCPDLVERAKVDPVYAHMLDIARRVTGCYRQTGLHAGGVVIGREELTSYTPLTEEGASQYDMVAVEQAGLVKFDFLGVKTLDVIDAAARDAGVDVRFLDPVDPKVYEMITNGDTWGLFQIESPGMTTMCVELKPDRFDDIVAALSLYRPGPMKSGMLDSFINRKHGRESVTYLHPLLEPALKPTYGTIIYQEQVMEAAKVLAGYSLGGADLLRRAMGKKKPEEMAKQRQTFVDGCAKNDIDAELATKIFDAIEMFAGYGFNRSHSAAYAMITYQTAWLKLHHPLQFVAALLTVEGGDQDKLAHYVRCARDTGIKILGPCVNRSSARFKVENGAVRWGLSAIKGLGEASITPLIAGAPYADFYDLAKRSALPKGVLETLVDAGACDVFGATRAALKEAIGRAVNVGKSERDAARAGQVTMFSAAVTYPKVKEVPEDVKLASEYAALGVFISGHPTKMLPPGTITPKIWKDHDRVTGVIVDVFVKVAKSSGKQWAKITIEDGEKSMRLIAFPKAFEEIQHLLMIGSIRRFYGRTGDRGEFVIDEAKAL